MEGRQQRRKGQRKLFLTTAQKTAMISPKAVAFRFIFVVTLLPTFALLSSAKS
jgi:hypothetical protein